MMPNKTKSRVIAAVRFLLAAVFLMYGGVKLLGGQYYYGDWSLTKDTVDGTHLVWLFYGYSPFYGRITGLFEFIPALLLLFRRTSTLGALALFMVSLNITLMDFAFDFPMVKYFALAYTLLLGFLLYQDRERLLAAFWRAEPIGREVRDPGKPAQAGQTRA